MVSNALVVEEVISIHEKDNYSNICPDTKVIQTKYVNKESFTVTDISGVYIKKIQSKLQLSHKLIAKHVVLTTITESVNSDGNNIIISKINDTSISISKIILNNKLSKIDEYVIEPPVIKNDNQGLFKPNNPVVYNKYSNSYDVYTFNILKDKEYIYVNEQTNKFISKSIVSHVGNVGPMIRFDKQPRLFEIVLSLNNCLSILDTSNIVVDDLNIIYSFETFVEFGKQYDEITIVDLALINSIGFVDAYPHNPLNSLMFDPSTGILRGTINFLDKVLYVIELENKSAIAIILSPKLSLPL